MKRDCPKLKKQANEKRDDSSKSANVVQNDNSDCNDGDMLSISTNQFVDAWILDSGCSYHITPNGEWFTSYMSGNFGSAYLGDCRCFNIVGVGDVIIKMKVWVYFVKQKSEVFAKFKLWKAEVENHTGRKIKYLRSDNGTEYTDSQFQKFCEEYGIQRHFSVRKTPHQNGVAKRMNRSLTERARCLILNAGLPKSFWAQAVSMACYLINRSPWASLVGKVAEEKGVKGYKFWDPVARKMVISHDTVFDEQFMLQQDQDKMPKDSSSSDTLQMELEPHLVAPENCEGSHPSSDDPVAVKSGGSSLPTFGGSTTNELQAYYLGRDK
ncbi:UNVERIFIED_CONTAM: hypothetical protein Sradi_4019600 [Sesamum radiatum]|uniref:Integrase catalytic domain-containing protein n=1 Tax=Sesamum radiatum TaxID=300843 RepID=A0AAW2PHM4_SESRA